MGDCDLLADEGQRLVVLCSEEDSFVLPELDDLDTEDVGFGLQILGPDCECLNPVEFFQPPECGSFGG